MKDLCVIACFVMLAGCATAPVEETKAFGSAVAAVTSAADSILDDFNTAERNRFYRQRGRSFRLKTADEAYYYSTIAEAPATRQFRRAMSVVRDYSELLRILVDGTNVQAVHVKAQALADTVSSIVADPRVKLVVGALLPLIDQLSAVASIEEAKRLAVAGDGPMRELLVSLRSAAPVILDEFLSDIQENSATPQLDINKRATERRVAISNYIVLLDRLGETFSSLIRAFEHPTNPVSLATLVRASSLLEADVIASRKALAALRGSST
ncbi:hypothetical protein [Tardiphaga sp.]|uniref:hypothetical protein n=1 Tax=Tardiphaga sp. TaxID=1926292 RepID=UPI00352AE0DC